MTEREWLACGDPGPMLDWVGYRLTDRQARLFAVACCRRALGPLSDERVRRFVQTAQDSAEGKAPRAERLAAEIEARFARAGNGVLVAHPLAYSDLPPDRPSLAVAAAVALGAFPAQAYRYAHHPDHPLAGERAAQAALLRDLLGWPLRPPTVHPGWLTPTVRSIAQAVADDDDFGRLPILADALEDAGCADPAFLGHCRDPALAHARGCWVVHQLLGPR
jgi:hypothetical protein